MTNTALKVVYTGPDYAVPAAQDALGDGFDLIRVDADPAELYRELSTAHALLDASMKVPITAGAIAEAPDLKLIVTATTGATHIDQDALGVRGIELKTLKGQTEVLSGLTPAAELTWSLILACARHLRAATAHVSAGGWERTDFPGVMLKGKTIGIIGFGRLGRWIGRYADAFGMRVQFFDPYQDEWPVYAEKVSLAELAASSDVVTVHMHVTPETQGMVSKDVIKTFRRGAIFVNTSRGELTDEAALLEAIKDERISAMGLDVLCDEPDVQSSAIWQYARDHRNVIVTPHIGGYSPDAVKTVVRFSADRLRAWFG